MAAEQLIRYAFDTAKDLSDTLHDPAVRGLMPCSCAAQKAPRLSQLTSDIGPAELELCDHCKVRHGAAELQRALNRVLDAREAAARASAARQAK